MLRWGRRLERRLAVWSILAVSVLCGAVLPGCHAPAGTDPEVLFQNISSDFLQGNLELARARAEKARAAYAAGASRGRGGDRFQEARFRLLEADILLRQNDAKAALALLGCSGEPLPQSADLAVRQAWLCGLSHLRLGQPEQANQEVRDARRLAEAAGSTLIGEVLRAEGTLERAAGHPDKALAKFEDSLAAARRYGDPLLQATDLIDIARESLNDGRFDRAALLYQDAADFARSVRALRHLQLALGNMGWAYQNLGDFEHALANFQQAEQLAREIGVVSNRVLWLQDAGLASYKLGHLEQARKYDEEALQAALTLPAARETDQVVNIRTNLALLLYEQRQYPMAKRYSDAAVLAARNSTDKNVIAYAGFVQGLLALQLANDADAERILMAARELTTDPDIRADVESALASAYAAKRQPRRAELWYRRSIETFEAKRSAVRDEALRLAAFGYGDTIYRNYADFLIDMHRPAEALRLLDRSRARTLEEGLGFTTGENTPRTNIGVDARGLARKLSAAILFYSLGRERSYVWAITPRETRLFELPGARDIESWVEGYQKAIQKSDDPLKTAPPSATALYNTLIGPAATLIGTRVFIVPDGALHALNFDTLLEPSAGGLRYWIERVAVTTASSLGMLASVRDAPAGTARRELLLLGNPVPAHSEFAALPNAAVEIREIQHHFAPESQIVLTQERAIPSAYEASQPDQFRYIHFVAHGTASRSSPLDSAVVLSPPQDRPQDFKLYARDIVTHPLNARLVTISACYGSGIRTYAGEGLVGLAWVFLRAGAHNVIGTLWQADDSATPILMDRLYTELQAGQPPDLALRSAKLTLIHSTNVWRKPFYWAAFQLYTGA